MEDIQAVEILIVEDNPADAELMLRALKKGGLMNKIFLVEDGAEALDFVFSRGKYSGVPKNKNLKVIFLDLKLPKISGLEVLQILKNNSETRKFPVVIVTSSRQDPDIKKAYELGANSYVVKPVEFDTFFETVKNLGLYWLLINEPSK
ncbi:MAG: response regulator [Sphingobacteriales bacterium]|nr:response regulator [Sphingobacteriales bacterium]